MFSSVNYRGIKPARLENRRALSVVLRFPALQTPALYRALFWLLVLARRNALVNPCAVISCNACAVPEAPREPSAVTQFIGAGRSTSRAAFSASSKGFSCARLRSLNSVPKPRYAAHRQAKQRRGFALVRPTSSVLAPRYHTTSR